MIPAPLGHLAYKLAYVGLRVWSFVLRPETRGVKCVVTCEGALLLVRHSYGPRVWDLPGGFARRGEPFADAARRELAEELSLAVPGPLTALGELRRPHAGRRETIGAIGVEVPSRTVATRGFELLRTGWFAPDALPERRADVVDEVLALRSGLPPEGRG
jgi:ADP-ribose pyrophosphatase YjhB (NUDIX family)